jgi:hypothetical protein
MGYAGVRELRETLKRVDYRDVCFTKPIPLRQQKSDHSTKW